MNWSRVLTLRLLPAIAAACLVCVPALAQNPRLTFTNLDKLAAKASEVVDVTLDGPMLKMAGRFLADSKEPEVAEARQVVDGLKGIYVKSYEFDKPGEYSMDDVQAIRAQLQSPGWARIVGVASKRDGEYTDVYLMTGEAGAVLGMAIISAEPEELTVVNIVGPIDINKLGSIGGKMGIPQLNIEKVPEKPEVPRED